jgi:arylsulfatase A-like enzyme
MKSRNVLFITIDQLRADVLNGPLAACIDTPNLDRLMREGVSFERHFTATVPCGPARASLLTGLYAMNHRSIRNGTPLADHHATLASEARKSGYEPLLFGYTDTTPDPTHLSPEDPALRDYEGLANGFREIVEMRFEKSLAWRAHLVAKGYKLPPKGKGKMLPLYRPVPQNGRPPRITDPAIYSADDSDTAFLTSKTIEALTVRHESSWFAHMTFIRPHPPLVAPAPYNTLVDPAAVPKPNQQCFDHPFFDAWFSAPTEKGLWWGFNGDCAKMSNADTARLRAVYLGLVAEVDFHLGRVLKWLEETRQLKKTLIVVTGDHGEMLGDKKMWGKQSVFEPAYHVPLIIRDPDNRATAGRRVKAITESVDITPTILEWIGRVPPPAMDGRPLEPLMRRGKLPAWRDAAFMEVDFAETRQATRFQDTWGLGSQDCNAAILREARWKYVHFNGGIPPMLFDLAADPSETRNLAADPAFAPETARMAQKMLDRRMTRCNRRLTGFSIGV